MRDLRQDIDLSDHHSHWHALYPAFLRDPSGSVEPKQDIQGRLFLYMHQQMLARYDTDRLAVGLRLVAPFLRWDDTPDGWKTAFENATLPADALAPWITESTVHDFDQWNYIGFDEKHSSPNQNAPEDVNRVIKGFRRTCSKASPGARTVPITRSAPTSKSPTPILTRPICGRPPQYRSRGAGHTAQRPPACLCDGQSRGRHDTNRFHRWHRAIDDFGFAWQESQGPDTTKYVTPPAPSGAARRRPPRAAPTSS